MDTNEEAYILAFYSSFPNDLYYLYMQFLSIVSSNRKQSASFCLTLFFQFLRHPFHKVKSIVKYIEHDSSTIF